MIKHFAARWLAVLLLALPLAAQQTTLNASQQLAFAGLRTAAGAGRAVAVRADSAGNLFFLLDQGDGVRLLKTNSSASTTLAETRLGAKGDAGAALALDPAGNVYVTGTANSGQLAATPGVRFPARTDSSTASFVARLDASLNPVFVSYIGGSRIAATALAVTADAVFVTGLTYGTDLPVTSNGIQQAPAPGSSQNGFVERFNSTGTTLVYATYLTGANGDVTPTALAATAADDAFIVGSTTASGYPTVAALVPAMQGSPSGFLTRLTPAGDGIVFSTFVPGAGLNGLALNAAGDALLATGTVALGGFPVDSVQTPLVATDYQTLLRIALDGSAVRNGAVVAPGTQSSVASAPDGSAWVGGTLSTPLLASLAGLGTGFAARVTAAGTIDQSARFGGLPNGNPTYASLPASIASVAVDPAGAPVVAGAVQPTASSGLLASQTFDLPLRNQPSAALPSGVRDARLTLAACPSSSLCAGSAAYAAKLAVSAAAPALAFSADDLPLLVLRNLGSADALGLALAATGSQVATNCGSTLAAGAECAILLRGGTAGTLTASTGNGDSQTLRYAAYTPRTSGLVFAPHELDFGIATAASTPVTRVITVLNLGTAAETFTSALDAGVRTVSPFSESATDCTSTSATVRSLAAGASCRITLALTASGNSTADGPLDAQWKIGTRDVALSGFAQAASESVSATAIAFGTQIAGGLRAPRYLYLSNNASFALPHRALVSVGAFTVADGCPATLPAHSVCRVRLDYQAAAQTSNDSTTLSVDGIAVVVTGSTLPPPSVGGTGTNPNLAVTPTSLTFADPVVVTGIAGASQTISVTNTGAAPFSLALAITGDFAYSSSCGSSVAAGQTCAIAVSFTPSQPGTRQGLLAVTAGTGTNPVYVALSGTGAPILSLADNRVDFGAAVIGQPVTRFFKVQPTFSSLKVVTSGPFIVALAEDVGFGPGQPPVSAYTSGVTGSCRNCYVALRYVPSQVGAQSGTLAFSSAASGATYTLALAGSGIAATGLVLSPAAQDFGSVATGSTGGSVLFTLTNLVAAGTAITVAPAVLSGDFALSAESTGGTTCAGTLVYGASCQFPVRFSPAATGTRTGSASLVTSAGAVAATLSGTGTPDPGLAIRPLALTFRPIAGTESTRQSVTLTNTGTAALTVGTATTSATTQFAVASTCGTLAAGASCTLTVTFAPAANQAVDTLSIPVTAAGSTQTTAYAVALNGSYTTSTAGLAITPVQAAYGPSATGTEGTPRVFTVQNLTAKQLALDIQIPRQFALRGAPCAGLAPNASCSFTVTSLPQVNADATGTLFARATPSDGSPTLNALAFVTAYGVGHDALTLSGGLIVNGVFNFGQVGSGQSAAQVFTLSNRNAAGTSPITVRRITSQPPFLAASDCGSALAPGASCAVTVTYSPTNQVASGTTAPASTTDQGALTVESDAGSSPDTLFLTGTGAAVGSSSPVNTVPLASFSLSQSSLTFATTAVGNVSATQTVTLSNTGTTTLHLLSLLAPADFTVGTDCVTIAPGASCSLTVTATPQSPGTKIGALELRTDAATALEFITLLGAGQPALLSVTPSALDFGSVTVGSTATLPVQVSNTSSTPVVFSGITASGDYSVAGTCPAAGGTLAAGTSCTVQVIFAPVATGTRAGTLSLASSASTLPLTVSLTGVGLQSRLVANPGSLGFGSVVVGVGSNLTVTLLNSGTAPVSNLVLAASGDFAVTIPCALAVLLPGQSCSVQVTFTPAAVGPRTGTLSVRSSDPGSPLLIPLSGTGVASGGFTLTVDGGPSSAVTVTSGQPAVFRLAMTPTGGFTGTVALTCTPVQPALYAFCSLAPSQVTLAGGAQSAVATLNTVTSLGGNASLQPLGGRNTERLFVCLLGPGLLVVWRARRRLRRRLPVLVALLCTAASLLAMGCGAGADPNLRYAPAGTYQYQVTASSTSGVLATQTVTLNLTIRGR